MSTLDSKTVTSGDEAGISRELLLKMWENMNLARNFEEHVQWLFSRGLVHGTTHLGIGEEATAAGTIAALKPQDYVFGTHRGHSQAICKGISVNNMMAEILARETGVCKGKGGSMHIADPDIHYFGADGILGASAVMCNGTALAIKKRGEKDRISLVFFGDGTSNEGTTWEAMNLAAVWQLPTLFVCVNNTYGMSTPIAQAMKDTDISKRAYPFDMPARSIDGNNVLEVYQTIKEAREYGLLGKNILETGFDFDLDIRLGAGDLSLEGVHLKALAVEMDMGSAALKNVSGESLSVQCNLGDFTLEGGEFDTAELTMSLGSLAFSGAVRTAMRAQSDMGDVDLSGALAGEIEVNANLGTVRIDSQLPRSAYALDLASNLGSLTVDGERIGTDSIGPSLQQEDGENSLHVRADMGDIFVQFAAEE